MRTSVIETRPFSGDRELVACCLSGDERAWSDLVDKYKRLIFSIPIKEGLSREEASDIFQAVCLDLVAALPALRDPSALPKWLIETTTHKCWRHNRQRSRSAAGPETLHEPAVHPVADTAMFELEKEQAIRTAVSQLPSRCRALVEMLFFETPPRAYRDVAASLGLAEGSIGFIRGRCLTRLRVSLRRAGL